MLTWDAYWALCRRVPPPADDNPMLAEANRMARDVEFADAVRKAVGITPHG